MCVCVCVSLCVREDSASLPHFSPSFLLADSRDALCTGVHRLCEPYFFQRGREFLGIFDGTPSFSVVVEVGPCNIGDARTVSEDKYKRG